MKKRNVLLLCIAAVSFFWFSSAGRKDVSSKSAKKADQITYAISASPVGKFNPLIADTQYDEYVNGLVYASLLRLNAKIELEPALAEKYEVSKDSTIITFMLRKGLTFHDGKPVTAEDVKFTLEALASPQYDGDIQSYVQSIKGFKAFNEGKAADVSGIAVKNDRTVEITFSEPYAPALINIGTLGILPKHIWKDVPVNEWAKATGILSKPIGCGAYQLESFVSGSYVKLTAFTAYYGGKPKTANFVLKVVNEATVQAELINGSVDIADVSAVKNADAKQLAAKGVTVVRYPNSKIQYMGFNLRDARLDLNVRTAIAYGIDRQAIVNGLIEGNGVVLDTPMVPSLWSYPKSGLTHYVFDAQKAKEYLKKAGYADTNGDGFVDKNGKNLQLTLTIPKGDKIREQTGLVIQSELKKIGIDIVLEPMDFNATMQKVVGNHEFELYLMGNTLDPDPDPTPYWYSTQATDEKGSFGWNIAAFRSKKADELMDLNRKQLNTADRKATLQEFGILLNKELPWVPLYAADIAKAYRSGVTGYTPNTFVDFYNVQNWEVVK